MDLSNCTLFALQTEKNKLELKLRKIKEEIDEATAKKEAAAAKKKALLDQVKALEEEEKMEAAKKNAAMANLRDVEEKLKKIEIDIKLAEYQQELEDILKKIRALNSEAQKWATGEEEKLWLKESNRRFLEEIVAILQKKE